MALTPKQEAFAQAVVTGISQSDAYRKAYKVSPATKPETVNKRASELMAHGEVAGRVTELRAPVAALAQITLESHLDDLLRLRNMAAKEGQYSAAISAEVARGKASGIHIEKQQHEHSGPNGGPMQHTVQTAEQFTEIAKSIAGEV